MDSRKKDYIIQEAESIIARCEQQLENEQSIVKKSIIRKYKKANKIMSIILVIETIICICLI